jgi:hypothetical protein
MHNFMHNMNSRMLSGRREIVMTDVPAILDVEASGFGKGSYPIEIGFVTATGQTWCSLIYPEDDWLHWDEHAAKIHNIPRHLLHERGNSARYVANQLNLLLQDACVYSDGWAQDYVWLARLYDAAGLVQQFRLEDLRRRLSPVQESQWKSARKIVEDTLHIERHRASSDALILQMTWKYTATQFAI